MIAEIVRTGLVPPAPRSYDLAANFGAVLRGIRRQPKAERLE
jgi:hypothetical protein